MNMNLTSEQRRLMEKYQSDPDAVAERVVELISAAFEYHTENREGFETNAHDVVVLAEAMLRFSQSEPKKSKGFLWNILQTAFYMGEHYAMSKKGMFDDSQPPHTPTS